MKFLLVLMNIIQKCERVQFTKGVVITNILLQLLWFSFLQEILHKNDQI